MYQHSCLASAIFFYLNLVHTAEALKYKYHRLPVGLHVYFLMWRSTVGDALMIT